MNLQQRYPTLITHRNIGQLIKLMKYQLKPLQIEKIPLKSSMTLKKLGRKPRMKKKTLETSIVPRE